MSDHPANEVPPTGLSGAGGSLPVSLVWHRGPAEGGHGTGGPNEEGIESTASQWWDGETLLIIVETNKGREFAVVHIAADEDYFRVTDASTGDIYDAWGPESWSWWAKLDKKNLPPSEANGQGDRCRP